MTEKTLYLLCISIFTFVYKQGKQWVTSQVALGGIMVYQGI